MSIEQIPLFEILLVSFLFFSLNPYQKKEKEILPD
jgi:hypothetical protein